MGTPIRQATPGDLERVTRFMQDFYAESGYALDRARAEAALAELIAGGPAGRLWLVLDADEPVGYVALTLGFSLEYYGRDAFIDDLFIRPAHRARGLGTQVLRAVEVEARALGVQALHLEVERGNRAGQALYRKQGFRDNERQLLSKRLHDAAATGEPAGAP